MRDGDRVRARLLGWDDDPVGDLRADRAPSANAGSRLIVEGTLRTTDDGRMLVAGRLVDPATAEKAAD